MLRLQKVIEILRRLFSLAHCNEVRKFVKMMCGFKNKTFANCATSKLTSLYLDIRVGPVRMPSAHEFLNNLYKVARLGLFQIMIIFFSSDLCGAQFSLGACTERRIKNLHFNMMLTYLIVSDRKCVIANSKSVSAKSPGFNVL